MTVYRTTFSIAAPAATVWKVLTDFGRYSEWNPSLPSVRGELRPGATVVASSGSTQQPDATVPFTHVERVHGGLFPIFRALMGRAIQRGHDAFNAALKARAEGPGES